MRPRLITTALALIAAVISLAPSVFASGGVIVRSSSGGLVFRRACDDSSGNAVSTGTTTLKIAELEDDGTLKTYDFSTNTFVTTTVTTETVNMTARAMNNGADATGIWTYSLGTVTGFTRGKTYFAISANTSASPPTDRVEFVYGGADGDLSLDTVGKVALQSSEHTAISGTDVPAALNTAQPGSPVAGSPFAHIAAADSQSATAATQSTTAATQATTAATQSTSAATSAATAATQATSANTHASAVDTRLPATPAAKSDVHVTVVSPQ